MTSIGSWLRISLLAGMLCLLGACLPSAENQSEEQLEAHFQAGKNRINAMDFKGATESFERALEVNPQNASAHFELGWLFDQKEVDPAAAIYHYNKYLKLRPKAGNAEMVRARVVACQQELASTVTLSPATIVLQKELQQLAEQNRVLRDELERWRAYAQRLQLLTNPPPATSAVDSVAPRNTPLRSTELPQPAPSPIVSTSRPAEAPRTAGTTTVKPPAASRYHTVKPNETPAIIARKYGMRVEKLLQANPRLDERRIKVGQTLVIPGS